MDEYLRRRKMSALVDGTDEQRRRLRKTLMEMSMGRGYLIINLETQRNRNKHKRDDHTDKNLVHLEISGYKDLVLPSLRDMKLETVKLSLPTLPPDSITNLVSECHQLKKLDVMIHDTDYQEIQIVSTSLQSLKIGRCYSHLHLACPQLIDASIYIGTDLYFWDSVSHYCCFRKKQRLSLKELEYRQTKVTLPVAFNHLEKLSLEVSCLPDTRYGLSDRTGIHVRSLITAVIDQVN
ncbi:hypothetical protein J5N97_003173 [Dioscorea zingiberensis]|uniref:Uncharacterized protein n=1 Tax=Dioscorea zingiberensis TaxID=325984 RepID=A0A9D5D5H0_9LILI|nr:hypothetical protein J5N97_003173 [Dioscorea zingiberensis]